MADCNSARSARNASRSPRCSGTSISRRISSPVVQRAQAGPDGRVTLKLISPHEYQPLPTDDDDVVGADLDPEKDDAEPSCGENLLESTVLQSFMAILIIANAGVIGLETDLPGLMNWDQIENLFLLIFTLELFLKMCIVGPWTLLYMHQDRAWTLFDMVIISLGIFDFTMSAMGGSGTGGFSTVFRIVRLLRILRIIKFLKQLYLLAFGLVEATKAVMWVAVLMCFVLYVCSIVLVRTVGRLPETDEHYEFLQYRFGGIPETMLTLFVLMSSPNLPIYQDEQGLLESKPIFCLFLVGFITFGSFGIIAMLTGVISESMFEKNEMRKEEARQEFDAMRKDLGRRAKELFETLPSNFEKQAEIHHVRSKIKPMRDLLLAAGANVTEEDVDRMVENMDDDNNGLISVQTFVHTMEKIAEGVHPLGIQELFHELASTHHDLVILNSVVDSVSARMEEMSTAMDTIMRAMKSDDDKKKAEAEKISLQTLCDQAEADRAAFKTQCSTFADSALTIVDSLATQTAQMRSDMELQFKELVSSQERMLQSLRSSLSRADVIRDNGFFNRGIAPTSKAEESLNDGVVVPALAVPSNEQLPSLGIRCTKQGSDDGNDRLDLKWEHRTCVLAKESVVVEKGAE